MTKETKGKVEITLEIYNNVKAMIKSSNKEDFFIAVEMWFAMKPPVYLSVILKRHAFKDKSYIFDENIDLFNKHISWAGILNRVISDKEYKPYRDIISQEFNAYINQKLMNEGIGKNIKQTKTEIKWHI